MMTTITTVRRENKIGFHLPHPSGRWSPSIAMARTRPAIIGAYLLSAGRSGHAWRARHVPSRTAA